MSDLNPFAVDPTSSLIKLLDEKLRPLQARVATLERRLDEVERHHISPAQRFLNILNPKRARHDFQV